MLWCTFAPYLDSGMEKMMKLHLKYLWIVLMACTLTACMNGGG